MVKYKEAIEKKITEMVKEMTYFEIEMQSRWWQVLQDAN
jgi:hypothetical protein